MSAALEPVSMKKGRPAPLPRLSVPYDPTKPRHARFWTPEEEAVVRALFPTKGAAACQVKLPQRSLQSIYLAARRLKLRGRKTVEDRQRHHCTPVMEQQIRDAWPGLTDRGAVAAFAAKLGQPRWWVSKQARRLGLTVARRKEPPWTAAENELMAKVPLHDPDRASELFREHGFRRSPTAIVVRAKRLGLSRRYKGTLSATSVAKILGVDSKTVTVWCIAGTLKAEKRATRRLPQQGGDPWSIERAELRRFIVDNIASIDIRKVDKVAFVDLLVNAPAAERGPA